MQHTLNATAECGESSLTRITEEALSLTALNPNVMQLCGFALS